MTDGVKNPNPPKEKDIVTGQFYHSIGLISKRGGPGNSKDKYYIDTFVSKGLRVVDGVTHVITMQFTHDKTELTLPLDRIFLTHAEAENVLPRNEYW